jgi:hypothetical protein
MAITGQWQNLPHGHYENAVSICAPSSYLPGKTGIMCILLHIFRVAYSLRVPISGEVPPSSA